MAPIRKGDGTGLAAAGYSQVRKGDGTVLWNAIPDSVVMQHYATTWSQGDATWADDATDDGSQDISVAGDPQAGTLSDGAESVNFDGTDDYGLVPLPSEFEGSGLNEFSVEVTFQSTATEPGEIFSVRNDDSDQTLFLRLGRDYNNTDDSGNILFTIADDNGDRTQVGPSSNPNLNDGNRHDVSVIVNDASQDDIDIIIDGTSVSVSFGTQENPSNFTTWDVDCGIAARNAGGTVGVYLDVDIGADRWHNRAINDQTISDYP